MSRRAGDLGWVLAALVRSAARYGTAVAADTGRRMAATLFGYLFAAGLLVVGLGFLTLSAHAAISQALGGVYASLIVGCLYLVAGLVTILVLHHRRR